MKSSTTDAPVKKRRGCLLPFLVLLFALLIIGIAVGVATSGGTASSSAQKSVLAETMDLTEQQEQDMQAIFDACGVVEIKEATKNQEGEESTSYYVRDDETEHYTGMNGNIVVWVDNSTKAVKAIYFDDQDIYVDGAVVAQVPDYYISSEQRDAYRVSAQTLVKECLNYPDTAEFGAASKWSFGVRDGYDVIQSSVTAKNAVGVESTEDFQIKVDRATGTAVSLILGGTEYIQ
jgi:uncharacterized protein (UPF0333 family)